jgi:hypothetical protein
MLYSCCDITFPSRQYYIKHLKCHQLKRDLIVKCDVCKDYCRGYDAFRKHNITKHQVDIDKEISESSSNNEPMFIDTNEESNEIFINNVEFTDEVQHYLNMFTEELDSNLKENEGNIGKNIFMS